MNECGARGNHNRKMVVEICNFQLKRGRRWTGTVTSPGWNMESSTEWLELAMYCGLFIFFYFQICWVYFLVLRT
jgi:hypothetical protein